MSKKYVLMLWAVFQLGALSAVAQNVMPGFEFPIFRHPAPGYYLVAPNPALAVSVVDHARNSIFMQNDRTPINISCTDSTLTYYDAGKGFFIRLNQHFQPIDSMKMSGGYQVDYHEGHILSNGNYIILGFEKRTINMAALVPGGQSEARVTGAVIQERNFNDETVFEWKSLDHIPVTDATEDIDLTQPNIDYIHVNAIELDNDGNYLVSCRHTDEIIKLNRTTGTVMWRLGGKKSKANQFAYINDNTGGFFGFSHQHDISRTKSGNLMMFDNGNLKPERFSRAVEYEVDEVNKTVKMVWSYVPQPQIFAASMGSACELPNGNILIGFGAAGSNTAGLELTRDGVIQAELWSEAGLTSYRLRKAVFAMSGKEVRVTQPGEYTFAQGDSNTHVVIALTQVNGPTSVITERHSYEPTELDYLGGEPCVIMPMRWAVRTSNANNLVGTMRFKLGGLGFTVPSLMKLYHRAREGEGPFMQLATAYDVQTNSITVAELRTGEFMIAYPMCYDPTPTVPANNATNVSNDVHLFWTPAVESGGYDVEVYRGSDISGTPALAWHATRIDTTITVPEPGALYSWRVRAIRPAPHGAGPWSAQFSFRTNLAACTALSPSSLPDSIAIPQNATFTYTRAAGAARYRIQVIEFGSSIPVIDTLVSDTSFRIGGSLPCNGICFWRVRGEVGTTWGPWSNSLTIVTQPCAPRLLYPEAGAEGITSEQVELEWSGVSGAKNYHVRVYQGSSNGPLFAEDTITATTLELNDLVSTTMYYWQVRTISRFGAGPFSPSQWFMTRGRSVLGKPSLLAPVDAVNVDTLDAVLTWTSVPEAMRYHVQLTSKPTFTKPDFEWISLPSTTKQCPPLEAGKVYHWRVMALNDIASGPWSDTARFTSAPGPDDALEPLTPVPGCIDVPRIGTVTFIPNVRFSEYRVEYATVPLFTTVDQVASVTGAVAPYNLAPEQQYFWHVIGLSNGVPVDTGSTASFVTAKDAPTSVDADDELTPKHKVAGRILILEGALQGAYVSVLDLTGRQVAAWTITDGGQHDRDLSSLPAGVYVCRISSANTLPSGFAFVLADS